MVINELILTNNEVLSYAIFSNNTILEVFTYKTTCSYLQGSYLKSSTCTIKLAKSQKIIKWRSLRVKRTLTKKLMSLNLGKEVDDMSVPLLEKKSFQIYQISHLLLD